MHTTTATVEVHVGIVALDPQAHPVGADLLDWLKGGNVVGDFAHVSIHGDSFSDYNEPLRDRADALHALVTLEHTGRRSSDAYADRARIAVASLIDPNHFRLADYVAVDYSPVWGEDQEVVGRYA